MGAVKNLNRLVLHIRNCCIRNRWADSRYVRHDQQELLQ